MEQREQELEAQIAELKSEKDRLLRLLDQALTALNRQEERASPPLSLSAPPAQTPPRKSKEVLQPGTWAWLKDWFLNA